MERGAAVVAVGGVDPVKKLMMMILVVVLKEQLQQTVWCHCCVQKNKQLRPLQHLRCCVAAPTTLGKTATERNSFQGLHANEVVKVQFW